MAESRRRILEMLEEKKITVEEAEKLLSLLGTGDKEESAPDRGVKGRLPKYLRVVVEPGPEGESHREKVNIRVPVSLIRAGMKFTSLIPSFAGEEVSDALKKKGVDFDLRNFKESDIEELVSALNDLEVDIDGEHGKKVHVYTE